MQTLAECDCFKWWSTSWYIAPCHQISGHYVISSHFMIWDISPQTWSKPIKENFKVLWNTKKWPSTVIFNSNLLYGTMHHHTTFQANSWNPQRVRAVTSAIRPGGQSSVECEKISQQGHFNKQSASCYCASPNKIWGRNRIYHQWDMPLANICLMPANAKKSSVNTETKTLHPFNGSYFW